MYMRMTHRAELSAILRRHTKNKMGNQNGRHVDDGSNPAKKNDNTSHTNGSDSTNIENSTKMEGFNRNRSKSITNKLMRLHWDTAVPRRGLGDLITSANHIAITVSDVGRSLWFYSDILGFQQIRRPNFDRHGAWLTMGNIELHLILGKPMVHSGDDLIVGHISVETNNISAVLARLKEMEIPFETNVSVPKGDENEGIVTQFFLRDPDGYYVEICNCGLLTDFCLGNDKVYVNGYVEGVKNTVELSILSKMILLAEQAKHNIANQENDDIILQKYDSVDGSNVDHDETKLENLLKRTKIYGDVIQGETRESLIDALKKTNNNIPEVILYIQAKHGSNQMYQPPTIYRNNEEAYTPPIFNINK